MEEKGKLEKLKEISSGAITKVYLAQYNGQKVIIKQLQEKFLQHKDLKRLLRNEYEILKEIDHDNIVKAYDLIDENNVFAIVEEYVEGETLEIVMQRLQEKNVEVPLEVVAEIFAQLLGALMVLKEKKVVHRDIAPDNIIVRNKPGKYPVVLIDFGFAKKADVAGISLFSARFGSLETMPPEAFAGPTSSTASDVFSAAVIIFRLLTGKHPYGEDEQERYERLQNGRFSRVQDFRPDLEQDEKGKYLANTINRAIYPAISYRLKDPQKILNQLDRFFPPEKRRREYISFFSAYYLKQLKESNFEKVHITKKEIKQLRRQVLKKKIQDLAESLQKKFKEILERGKGKQEEKKEKKKAPLVLKPYLGKALKGIGVLAAAVLALVFLLIVGGGKKTGPAASKFVESETLSLQPQAPAPASAVQKGEEITKEKKESTPAALPQVAGGKKGRLAGYIFAKGKVITIVQADGKEKKLSRPEEGPDYLIILIQEEGGGGTRAARQKE